MLRASDRPHSLAAIRIDLGAIFVSVELSKSTWLITSLSPGAGERMSKHVVRAGDVAGLMSRFSRLREKARARQLAYLGVQILQIHRRRHPFRGRPAERPQPLRRALERVKHIRPKPITSRSLR